MGALPIVLAVAWIFAYYRLVGWDPTAGARNVSAGIEAFFFAPSGSSPTLLLILAAWITVRRRYDLYAALARDESVGASTLGFVAIVAAAMLSLWAQYVDYLGLMIPAQSLMLLGAGLFLAGWRGGLILLVPALFLILAYPHSAVAVNAVIYPLQLWTAKGAAWVLELFGAEPRLSGDLIFMPDGRVFQVIESCAGLRSIETMLMSAVVYAEIFGRRGAHALILVAVAPLMGAAVNQARVLSLVVNPFSSIDPIHSAQGIAMIVVGVLAVAGLDMALKRLLPAHFDRSWAGVTFRWRPDSDTGLQRGAPRILALCALLAAIGVSAGLLPEWSPRPERLPPLSSLPAKLDGWRAAGLGLDNQFLGSVGFVEWVHRRYFLRDNDPGIRVFLGSNNRLEPRMSLISEKTAVPGTGFSFVEKQSVRLNPDQPLVDRILWRRGGEYVLTLHWYLGVASFAEELARSALALDRGPLRRPGRSVFARLSISLPRSPERRLQVEQQLRGLATRIQADLVEMGSQPR